MNHSARPLLQFTLIVLPQKIERALLVLGALGFMIALTGVYAYDPHAFNYTLIQAVRQPEFYTIIDGHISDFS